MERPERHYVWVESEDEVEAVVDDAIDLLFPGGFDAWKARMLSRRSGATNEEAPEPPTT